MSSLVCKLCGQAHAPKAYTINREQAEICKSRGLEYIRQIEVKEGKLAKQQGPKEI